ncbi:hypothetical protein AQY21_20640 [Paracoccus sp. MKU1]|nr:hypothetical protein AQY21_20640 [Paracoccus sp. MKU1]
MTRERRIKPDPDTAAQIAESAVTAEPVVDQSEETVQPVASAAVQYRGPFHARDVSVHDQDGRIVCVVVAPDDLKVRSQSAILIADALTAHLT